MALAGEMFISERILRMPLSTFLNHSISAVAASSATMSSARGHGRCIRLSSVRPSFGATDCQISSVMNGITGCSARSTLSSTTSKV